MRYYQLLVAVFAVVAGWSTCLTQADAAPPIVAVTGGGRADFIETDNSVNNEGFTNFGIGAHLYADGTARGRFVCQVPAVVVISGRVTGGELNPDGSVTFWGLANGYDSFIPGPYSGLPFKVTLRPGGPGSGGFDYRDESGFFGPGQLDTEIIRRGMIKISK